MTVYYLNMRDLKSKLESLKCKIEEIQPTIIALTETWLGDEEELTINGYQTIYRNERDSQGGGGGMLVAVHDSIRHIVVETARTKGLVESLWIVVNNEQVKLKIGVVYFPQEKDTTRQEMDDIYEQLSKEINDGKAKGCIVTLIGDFNCKVGAVIKGNCKDSTWAGKRLLKMNKDEKMTLMNATDKCRGTWTRSENGKNSILDYMLLSKGCEEIIKELVIDEDKELAPLRVRTKNREEELVYSDHNVHAFFL